MKSSTSKRNFGVNSSQERVTAENMQKNLKSSSKAVDTMPEQFIIPPARVWNKIEAILDEQDSMRKKANDLIATSLGFSAPAVKRKKVYLATVAGVSALAGLIWMIA